MVIGHRSPGSRLKAKGLMSSLSAKKKTLLNGTKMFLRIYFYHITNEEMFKTSKILNLG